MLSATNAGLDELPIIAPESLYYLDLADNHITDLGPLAGHTALRQVTLAHNDITDIGPIAQAPWVLADCVELDVQANPLDVTSTTTTLPAMCEHNIAATWDQGMCAWDPEICDVPI